jgi:hypothetical protein
MPQHMEHIKNSDILKHKYRNFADMKRIYATYRIFKSGVKSHARKMRL